jgi:magnesium transporter
VRWTPPDSEAEVHETLLNLVHARDGAGVNKLIRRTSHLDAAVEVIGLPEPERAAALGLLDAGNATAFLDAVATESPEGLTLIPVRRLLLVPELVTTLLAARQFTPLHAFLKDQDPVDIARLLEDLPAEQAAMAFRLLHRYMAVDVLQHMDTERQQRMLQAFSDERVAALVLAMSPDDRTRLLDEVPAVVTDRLLRLLPPGERQAAAALLGYPEKSAGRVMTPDFVSLQADFTVGQALDCIRLQALDKETIYYSYVTDPGRRLLGAVSLKELLLADSGLVVGEIMRPGPRSVSTHTDQEEVADVLREYDLLAVPVVDTEGRLVGIITWDDVLDIMVAEATEDIHHMAGLGVKERISTPMLESASRRIPWLAFNMTWAFAGAAIINLFEGTLQQVAALAVFMPLIAGQAGNAGIQTATIVVRSMALGDLERVSVWRLLVKEWGVGFLKGALFGSILLAVAFLVKGNLVLAVIAGGALFLNMLVASTGGVLVPIALRRTGIDPATVAGVFDTMLTDFMGFLIYLGLATIFISVIVRQMP